jgi:uncharacterized protein (TIGR02118 family)
MIKLVYVIARRADVPAAKFYDYWRNTHAPLVAKHAKTLRLRKYVQSHTLDVPAYDGAWQVRGMKPPVAGITEVWWDSVEDLQQAYATAEGAAAGQELADDEAKFIDFANSHIYLTQEHVIFDYTGGKPFGPDHAKATYILARRDDFTQEACHKTWLNDHGPLVRSYAELLHMRKYVQSHEIAHDLNLGFQATRGLAPPLDGLTEVWLDSLSALDGGTPEMAKAGQHLIDDEKRFVNMARSHLFLSREHLIFDHTR